MIDQGAIRGSRRSNPATYTGLLDPIRKAFAKANGVKPALFSSNSEGACPTCNGAGVIYTELGVMATVESTCEECEGKRFQAAVLEYTFGGKNISEVLGMSVAEAEAFFGAGDARYAGRPQGPRPAGRRRARLPHASASRSRRCPAASGSASSWPPRWPTRATSTSWTSRPPGLHLADVENLLGLLDRLVDSGKSVIVIEHHQAVMAHADWIIDLGPGAGHDGGRIVFEGTPAELVAKRVHAHRQAPGGVRRGLSRPGIADNVHYVNLRRDDPSPLGLSGARPSTRDQASSQRPSRISNRWASSLTSRQARISRGTTR